MYHHSFPLRETIPGGWVGRSMKNKPVTHILVPWIVMEDSAMLHGPTGGSIPAFAGALDIESATFILCAAGLMNRGNKFEEGSQEQMTSIQNLLTIAEQVDGVQCYPERSLTGHKTTVCETPECNLQSYCT